MNRRVLGLGFVLFTLSSSLPTLAALNHNPNSTKALSKAYGFLLGQEYSLRRIETTYPALRIRVEAARLAFNTTFAGVKEKIEQELTRGLGEENFQKLSMETQQQIAHVLGQQALTREIAEHFLDNVRARAKGGDMEADVLSYLLAAKYAQAPVAEFLEGFRQSFATDGSGKSQGIRLKLQLPQSWFPQDGERPHVVQKWTNEGGTGLSTVLLDIRDAQGAEPSARDIEEFVKSGEARQTFLDLGSVHGVGTVTIEGRVGYWGEISMLQERAGTRIYQRGMVYQLYFKGKAIGIICMAGAPESESQEADVRAILIKPLCSQILNSLVLEQAY